MSSILKSFYIFCSLALTLSFSVQASQVDPLSMYDEEFEAHLGSLPRFTPQEMEEIQRQGDLIMEAGGGMPQTVAAPKWKKRRRVVIEAPSRQP